MVTPEPAHESFAVFALTMRLAFRIPLRVGTSVTRILGRTRVEAVELTDVDSGATQTVACDTIVFTGDWVPDHELAVRGGFAIDRGTAAPTVDTGLRTSVPGVFAAGNLLHGAETADVCALDGRWVAQGVGSWLTDGTWPAPEIALHAEAPLRWVSPNVLASGQRHAPQGRLLVRTAAFARAARVEARQAGSVLWSKRARLVPARTFSMSDEWLERVDPAGGPVSIALGT
jgi:hypothetical protein